MDLWGRTWAFEVIFSTISYRHTDIFRTYFILDHYKLRFCCSVQGKSLHFWAAGGWANMHAHIGTEGKWETKRAGKSDRFSTSLWTSVFGLNSCECVRLCVCDFLSFAEFITLSGCIYQTTTTKAQDANAIRNFVRANLYRSSYKLYIFHSLLLSLALCVWRLWKYFFSNFLKISSFN